jgi:hypothetical protein
MPIGNTINKKQVVAPAIAAALAVMMVSAMLSTPAYAAAHFVRGPTYDVTTQGNTATLTVSFKAAGLGNEPATVSISADNVQLETECQNRGGNFPGGQQDTGTAGFTSEPIEPKNGQITTTQSLTVTAENTCPDKMKISITSATFEGIVLEILDASGDVVLTDTPPDQS